MGRKWGGLGQKYEGQKDVGEAGESELKMEPVLTPHWATLQ